MSAIVQRLSIAVTLAALLAACRSAAPAPRLNALFTDLHARGLFSGAVVVAEHDRILFEKGYGDANAEKHVAYTPDTPTDGASLAKTFTAALLLALEREGVLRLDDPAQKYLPELPYPEITLRHLLSHSSGIPSPYYEYFDAFLPPGEIRTTERLLGVIAEQKPPLRARPGTAFEYSSFAYDLAALAAARAAGKPYGALLEERYFRPLGITSAFLRPAKLTDFPGIRTMSYRDGKVDDVFEDEAFHGGSNIYLSARDLQRWNAWMLAQPPAPQAQVAGHPTGLTLGSWYSGGTASWYSGHLQGFHSVVYRDAKKRRSIVYVSNNTVEPWMQHGVIRAINSILDGRPHPPAPPPTDVVRKDDYDSLTGQWRLPHETVVIDRDARHLFLTRNGVRYLMVQIDPKFFYIPGLDFIAGFIHHHLYLSTNLGEEVSFAPRPPSNK